jgi:hypothetical protein
MSTATGPSFWNNVLFDQSAFGGNLAGLVLQSGSGIIYPALRKAAITLGPQRTPSPAQFQDAIDELNRLIGSLNIDRYNIYSRYTVTAPLNGGKTYTIGISGDPTVSSDFNVPRPNGIEAANIVSNQTPPFRYPLRLVTDLQWSKIRVQDIPNAIPEVMYNDRAFPVATLYLWGQPIAGYLLELYCWQSIPSFQSISDVVILPDGYVDALVLNLAVRLVTHFPLGPNMPRQVDPNLYQQAREALMRVQSLNAPQPVADTSALGSCRNRYNIYNDTWR